jgi:hypothetical protein
MPMLTDDEDDADDRALAAAAAAASAIGQPAAAAAAAAAAGAAPAAAAAAPVRRPGGALGGGLPPAINPYRGLLGSFDSLMTAAEQRSWSPSRGLSAASGGAARARGPPPSAADAARAVNGRWRVWGNGLSAPQAGRAAGAGAYDDYEDEPGMEDDEDCPGLVDEEVETEEDEDDEWAFGGGATAAERAFTLTWRRMLMPPGGPGSGGSNGALPAVDTRDARVVARQRLDQALRLEHAGAWSRRRQEQGAAAEQAAAAPQEPLSALPAPQACTFLRPGACFTGVQRLSHQLPTARRQDDWSVTVFIEVGAWARV